MAAGDLRIHARSLGAWTGILAALAVILFLGFTGKIGSLAVFFSIVVIVISAWIGVVWARHRAFSIPVTGTPQMQAEDDLIAAMIGAMPQPALVLDPAGRVIALNPAVVKIAPALRIDEPVSLALRAPDVVEAIRRVLGGGAAERVEFVEHTPAGRWLEAFVTPFHVSGATSLPENMLLLAFNDLSPLRRVEEMRADFVANASHELRTPLAALSGFIETLKGSARNDEAARERFLNIMESQATRMARLIDDLLSLSRIELNAHLRPDKPVELLGVIRQVVDALQTLAKDRGVEVSIQSPPEGLTVPGDRDELIRVFENLIENALKYGASGGKVEIMLSKARAADGSGEAVVAVRDYGPGIAIEHLPRLTERFYRVDVAGSRAQGGTGLGLALVKHILNRHHGRLSIDSKLGEGATFTVRMPLLGAG